VEGTTRSRLRPAALVRKVLLPPVLAGVAIACLLGALAVTAVSGSRASGHNPLGARAQHRELASALSLDLEGTPSASDVRSVRRPLSERQRVLERQPYYALYLAAQRRYDVPWVLVASIHFQQTGFEKRQARHAARDVASIAAQLHAAKAPDDLGPQAARAVARRYGSDPAGEVSTAMVMERAKAWRLLGTIPMPGHGELERPVDAPIGGCGYFGCPRPGHLHNGDDFLAPAGTPVHAADVGTVAFVQTPAESGGYGNFVCLQHRPHLASCYAHLSVVAPQIKAGAHVRRGQVVGLVGSTGSSTAPHLHFEVREGPATCQQCAVDPMPLLSAEVPQDTVARMLHLAQVSASLSAPAVPPPAAAIAGTQIATPAPAQAAPAGPGVQAPAGATTPVTPAVASHAPATADHASSGTAPPSGAGVVAPPARTTAPATGARPTTAPTTGSSAPATSSSGPTVDASSSGGAAAPGAGSASGGAAPSAPPPG
jgi:murein DD-endopeptidase MepM/ murein hydrolase activator NlpD